MIPSTAGWEPMSSLSQVGSNGTPNISKPWPRWHRRMCQAKKRASPQFQCWPGQARPRRWRTSKSSEVIGFLLVSPWMRLFPLIFPRAPWGFSGPRWVRTLNYEICVSQENICIYIGNINGNSSVLWRFQWGHFQLNQGCLPWFTGFTPFWDFRTIFSEKSHIVVEALEKFDATGNGGDMATMWWCKLP